MECPYCNGKNDLKNFNLTHKYEHNHIVNGKNKIFRFKYCHQCKSYYVLNSKSYTNSYAIPLENLSQLSICSCGAWLPDFPTSWIRSITNLDKLWELLNDINSNSSYCINKNTLYKIQRSHNGIIYNPQRANAQGVQSYLNNTGKRRMNEYLATLRNLGLIKNTDNNSNELTRLAQEIMSCDNDRDIWTYLVISYLNIKLMNGYQQRSVDSCYQYFKIRFTYNILKVIKLLNDSNKGASSYQVGISLLCRNSDEFKKYYDEYICIYSDANLKDFFFKHDNELRRSVISTLLNVYESLGLITMNKTKKLYYLTNFGKKVFDIIDNVPSLWWDDIERYSTDKSKDKYEVCAKILIYRLIKNKIIKNSDLKNIDTEELDTFISDITNCNPHDIRDIQFNLFYDEFNLTRGDTSHTNMIIKKMKNYIDFDECELKEMCSILTYSLFSDIRTAIDDNLKDISFKIKSDTKLQSGRAWHDKSVELLNNLGFETKDYKDKPVFANIHIDKLKTMLPGGTIHNPDILILENGIGKKNCILVDAKSQSSITSEVAKLMGYNLYSKNEDVDSFTIIPLQGNLPQSTKKIIEDSIGEFDRITIIEESALEYMNSLNLSKDEYLNILNPSGCFKYINVDILKSYS